MTDQTSDRGFRRLVALVVLIVALATVYVTKEFLTTIMLSVFMTYLLYPVHQFLHRLTSRRSLSSFLSILLVFAAFVLVATSALSVMATEVSNLSGSEEMIVRHVSSLTSFMDELAGSRLSGPAARWYDQLSDLPAKLLTWGLSILSEGLSGLLSDLPIRFAQFMMAVFFTYYLLVDGGQCVWKGVELLPERALVDRFLLEIHSIYTSLFNVYFITSMLSGLFAAVGFFLLGIPYPVLWGSLVAIFTLIPMVGPLSLILPMSIYYILGQDYLRAVLLLILGVVVLTIIPENVLRPRLAQQGASIHPAVTILAYTAPLFVVGLSGIVVGPFLYGFLLAAYRTAASPSMAESGGSVEANEDELPLCPDSKRPAQ
ncbi:MAG TPA: AI-2E family transporter [Methanotrichaceae archaeon]|nr:AI-2E family transporter [Methanotrichaceae archaeon]HQF16571.1 AI-2E family transporter [Methanotrichaceae archaeon]HQI91058.1 AI-2E family transporter [Methanotrichaceae archaeon]HQJ28551.1 AI-2E family transporter [Methanotrichaceae archaeon]